jgi:hypothetical protein
MTNKTTAFKFAVTTVAIALGIIVWSSAVTRLSSTGQVRPDHAAAVSPEIAETPSLQLSRVRLLVSNLN